LAGFLDRETRVEDIVLTNYGKRLLSTGDLHFCFWAPSDDEIDYDPVVCNSSSISEVQLSESIKTCIEDTPIREAVHGYRDFNGKHEDFTNIQSTMFTKAQAQDNLPRAKFPIDTDRVVSIKQRKNQVVYIESNSITRNVITETVDTGVERFDSSFFVLEFDYENGSFPADFNSKGFRLEILKSGSSGFNELTAKRDMSNDLSFDSNIKIFTGVKR
jgi:hypothetical protein